MLNIDDPNELTQKWESGFDGTKSYDKSFISKVDAREYGTMAARYIMLKYPSNFGLTDEDIHVIKYLNAAEKKLDSYDIEEDEQYISLLGILEENGIEV